MPARTDESPPRQQDEALKAQDAGRPPLDEVRSVVAPAADRDAVYDTGLNRSDDPGINTHGSER